MFDTNPLNGNTSLAPTNNLTKANNGGGNTTLKTPDNNYAWWYGTDGNIWANINGNVQKLSEGSLDYNGQGGSYFMGVGMNNGNITSVPLYAKNQIADPNPGNGNANGQGGATSSVNSALAAANAEKARRTSEAQGIKNSMAGKRDQIENMLKDILANIKSVYDEEKTKRDEQYEGDSSALIDQLNQALPDIGSSFAAIGAYDSSWNNDAQGRTKEEHNKAQEEIKKEYDADMVTLGDKKNQAETNARNARDNFMIDFDTFNDTEANSDNLENLRASKNSLIKAMNDFNAQGDYFKPGSTLQKEMAGLGSYNGQKVRDSFSSFLNTAGAGGSGVEAVEASGNSLKANKNKKEKSEIEQNKATGVSK